MNIDDRLNSIRQRRAPVTELGMLAKIATNEQICEKLAEYFDADTGGECSPTRCIQQILLEIHDDIRIQSHKNMISMIERGYR